MPLEQISGLPVALYYPKFSSSRFISPNLPYILAYIPPERKLPHVGASRGRDLQSMHSTLHQKALRNKREPQHRRFVLLCPHYAQRNPQHEPVEYARVGHVNFMFVSYFVCVVTQRGSCFWWNIGKKNHRKLTLITIQK